jgi:prefoldin subunit 5
MKYCVIVQLNRSSVSLYYQQNGLKALPLNFTDGNQHPLYFYLNNNNLSFGAYARQQFLNGDPNAFGNYFDLIVSPNKTFNFYGGEKQIKYLFYYAIEQALNHFFSAVLFEPSPIESYRTDFPLRFVFEDDIMENEIRLIGSLFAEAGFQNAEAISFNQNLFAELFDHKQLRDSDPVLKLQSINGNLFLQYFKKSFSSPASSKMLSGLGIDPRIKIIAGIIFNAAVSLTRSTLDTDTEINNLSDTAQLFLKSGSAQPYGTVRLSDGSSAFVRFKLKEVNDKLLHLGLEAKLFNAIDEFILKNQVDKTPGHKLLLVGEEMNSAYFVSILTYRFSNIVSSDPQMIRRVIERIARNIESNDYRKTTNTAIDITDETENINQLVTKIELLMKSKKELETELTELTREVERLKTTKSSLQSMKSTLLTDVDVLNAEITVLRQVKPIAAPVPPSKAADDFFNVPIGKPPVKAPAPKEKGTDEFNF